MVYMLFAGAVLLEVCVHMFGSLRAVRRVFAIASLCLAGVSASALFVLRPHVFSAVIGILSLYRMFNMIRIVEQRMHEKYLRRACLRTSCVLLLLQGATGLSWWAWESWHTTGYTTWAIIGLAQMFVAIVLFASAVRSMLKTAWPVLSKHFSDQELPSVTIAIPARNETEDLQRCLESVVASDYPKLEVIVLDDCSQTKRTPEIIKSFAQSGVRFVQGLPPEDVWLPKNQAYERLFREASGSFILFCGVDIRFDRDSIRQLITFMKVRSKQMVCVLPRRDEGAYGRFSLIQAMRYWWELALPRRSLQRPPVLSSCWVIAKDALTRAGGFKAVSRSIVPEAHFARQVLPVDGYSFVRAGMGLGIRSIKRIDEQRDTAVRMRYPQLHKRPEQVALLAFAESIFLLMPFILAIAGFWVAIDPLAHGAAILASVLLIVAYELSVLSTQVNTWWFGLAGQPLAVLVDIGLLHYSMFKYEFATVAWKGRNVCIPAMHVVPHLPAAESVKGQRR